MNPDIITTITSTTPDKDINIPTTNVTTSSILPSLFRRRSSKPGLSIDVLKTNAPRTNCTTTSPSGNSTFVCSPSPSLTTTFTFLPPSIHLQDPLSLTATSFDFIFDVRPYNLYSKSRIASAINICVPTTLLKRTSMTLLDMLNFATNLSQYQKDFLVGKLTDKDANGDNISILIYDQCSSKGCVSFSLYQTSLRFDKYDDRFNTSVLQGGFQSVLDTTIIDTQQIITDVATAPISATPPIFGSPHKVHKKKAASLSGFTLPSATNFKTKFVRSIKKNNPSHPITTTTNSSSYTYTFKFPGDLDYGMDFPNWLQFLINQDNSSIIQYFNHQFETIEDQERKRLRTLASNFNPLSDIYARPASPAQPGTTCCESCKRIQYMMPQGVEYGFKNRYKNIWPYEHSRVKLASSMDIDGSDDYFNGNFIDSKSILPNPFTYVATQNPLSSTIDDFWRVISQENIGLIINLDSTPINYFDSKYVDSVQIIHTTESYIVRKINNKVFHFHYLHWPDFGVPQNFDSLLDLIKYKNHLVSNHPSISKNVLVHCSAGCGRTGVYITIDSLISAMRNHSDVTLNTDQDLILSLVQHQRRQRLSMVQNLDQYIVCYEIFLHYLSEFQQRKMMKEALVSGSGCGAMSDTNYELINSIEKNGTGDFPFEFPKKVMYDGNTGGAEVDYFSQVIRSPVRSR
ncbi:uncharacterized protein J8A68_000404 [[Candida] subhashii]|uniref:Protein-tyrosine-phosphatase n=1 Tax=[Candida] subhashii TaxID=561895 RepID=A0A8J5V1T9_9ASCO|nr:uncharacterized protein J8A68_000404 [[Candida] subhashii]KAG7665975.1 hypothetical protein J8A68_000404 [[Candida] subhashii]